jgi:hypothetical protein
VVSTLLPPAALPAGWLDTRLALTFHGLVALASIAVLALPVPSTGMSVLLIVVGYHLAMLGVAGRAGAQGWWTAWAVLAPLSVLMVLPDWFLSSVLGTLRFADTGAPFVGTVPVFMAGMWVMALFPVVLVAASTERRLGPGASVAAAGAGGLLLFWVAERLAPVIPLWEPVGVQRLAGVAVYVLPAELVLSIGTWILVRGSTRRPQGATAIGVALLPLVYLGALALGFQFLG